VTVTAVGVWAVRSRSSNSAPPENIEVRERQVTSNPFEAPVFFAAISSDGRYVAYSDIHGLHIRFVDTGETRTVPVPSEFCFT
jgi:hypothetical protein